MRRLINYAFVASVALLVGIGLGHWNATSNPPDLDDLLDRGSKAWERLPRADLEALQESVRGALQRVSSSGPKPAGRDWPDGEDLIMLTWNVRGYPEKNRESKDWFSRRLIDLGPHVVCIQEIGSQRRVDTFLAREDLFPAVAFKDSKDGQDNAIFASRAVQIDDLPDPQGFQHPAQAAYVSSGGFDAVIVTVHLSWTNRALRKREKTLLSGVVVDMARTDPDVLIVGDFNTKEQGIQELARSIGLVVMVPEGQDGVGTTHAGNRYDHFLVSRDLAAEEALTCRIVTFEGDDLDMAKKVSDHLPVQARFRVEDRFRDRG